MKPLLTAFLRDERGLSAAEYGLIAGLMVTTLVIGVEQFAPSFDQLVDRVRDGLSQPDFGGAGSNPN